MTFWEKPVWSGESFSEIIFTLLSRPIAKDATCRHRNESLFQALNRARLGRGSGKRAAPFPLPQSTALQPQSPRLPRVFSSFQPTESLEQATETKAITKKAMQQFVNINFYFRGRGRGVTRSLLSPGLRNQIGLRRKAWALAWFGPQHCG